MSKIQHLIEQLTKFRDQRNWKQFHNPKDLAIALNIETSELLELFLWKDKSEIDKVNNEKIKEELADIFSYALLLLNHYDLDLTEIIEQKIALNIKKYPIEKAKGNATKYNEL